LMLIGCPSPFTLRCIVGDKRLTEKRHLSP
jgi:hypothetical protein